MLVKTQFSQRAGWAGDQPISDLIARALANPGLISLAAGFVDQGSLPAEATREALNRMLQTRESAAAALQYGTTHGYPKLRQILRQQTLIDAGDSTPTEMEQIVITAGSNQLLHLVSETILDPGDIVLCASPTYLVYLGVLANLGATALGVASDEQGMIPEALTERLRDLKKKGQLSRVKAVYLVPYFDNPCGTTIPAERRRQIVETAKRYSELHRIHVLEDGAYRELRYDGEDVASSRVYDEEGDTVVVAGTFSKSYSPGIRVGWGVLPQHLVGPLCSQKGNFDFGSPNFNQHLMAEVLAGGDFDEHVRMLRANYRTKLTAMLEAAHRFLQPLAGVHWLEPSGGLYVWLVLPPEVDTGPQGKLFDLAVKHGVLYVPGQYCFPTAGEGVLKNTIRLSFGVQSPENISRGMEALARAIQELESDSAA